MKCWLIQYQSECEVVSGFFGWWLEGRNSKIRLRPVSLCHRCYTHLYNSGYRFEPMSEDEIQVFLVHAT